ncbi:hypothetical protein [Catellatospora sichuanensis]|uniref:hypothetical protein n=1 Tax=Catellatospora sichuanensis TaxID=1969805 RepID=UPI0011826223|nr:hypothetical protein [Catellatospora sichuanensis]
MWPFKKPAVEPVVTSDFIYEEEDPPEDPVALEWDLKMAVAIRKLSAIYVEQNWHLHFEGKGMGVPLPAGLLEFIAVNVADLHASEAQYSGLGRMLFFRDQDYPDDIDIYLHVGTASPRSQELDLV